MGCCRTKCGSCGKCIRRSWAVLKIFSDMCAAGALGTGIWLKQGNSNLDHENRAGLLTLGGLAALSIYLGWRIAGAYRGASVFNAATSLYNRGCRKLPRKVNRCQRNFAIAVFIAAILGSAATEALMFTGEVSSEGQSGFAPLITTSVIWAFSSLVIAALTCYRRTETSVEALVRSNSIQRMITSPSPAPAGAASFANSLNQPLVGGLDEGFMIPVVVGAN